jgi:hypothetical protein
MHSYCRVIGCPHPARAGSANGLDTRFCRKHADHYGRHGSPYKRSYTAAELKPHRQAVRRWLKDNRGTTAVQHALRRIDGLYNRAGSVVPAFSLAGLTPRQRANVAWARLREAGVPAERALEAWLVIDQAITADPQPDDRAEFQRVQAAKLVHRLASGSHRRWERSVRVPMGPGFVDRTQVTELHKYPHSRGRVLRVIGDDLYEACGLVAVPPEETPGRPHG